MCHILNNIFICLGRISYITVRGYQLVYIITHHLMCYPSRNNMRGYQFSASPYLFTKRSSKHFCIYKSQYEDMQHKLHPYLFTHISSNISIFINK
jgi:hypothetical protein